MAFSDIFGLHVTRKKSTSGSQQAIVWKILYCLDSSKKKKNELIKLKLNPLFIIQY